MSWLRDMLILLLIGCYLAMALASEAATSPYKPLEDWVVTVGHAVPEQLVLSRGQWKERKVWMIGYKVGERLAGQKVLTDDFFQKFEKELQGFIRLGGTRNSAALPCEMPVLVHHRETAKITRQELCPMQMAAADQLKFGDWYRRWQLWVTQDQVF